MFLVSLVVAGLSGCIYGPNPSTSPPPITLNVNDPPKTFSVQGFMYGPPIWSTTGFGTLTPVPGSNSLSYTYTPVCEDVGNTFNVMVQSKDQITCINQVVQWTVTVFDIPIAEAGNNQTINLGDTYHLDGSASYDLCCSPLTYEWTIVSGPAGYAATLSDYTIVNPTFTPDICGTYEIQLIVCCGATCSVPDTMTLVVTGGPPVAEAGPNQHVSGGTLATLDGSGSTDLCGIASYLWQQINGPAVTLVGANTATPTFTAPSPGVYILEFELTVKNIGGLSSTDTCIVYVP